MDKPIIITTAYAPSSSKIRTVLSRKTSGIPSCSSVRTSCSLNSSKPSLRSSSIRGMVVLTVLESGLKVSVWETASKSLPPKRKNYYSKEDAGIVLL